MTNHRKNTENELAESRETDGLVSVAAALRAIGHALLCGIDADHASTVHGETRPTVEIRNVEPALEAQVMAARRAAFKNRTAHGTALPPVATDDEAGPESWPLPNVRAALNRDGGEHA